MDRVSPLSLRSRRMWVLGVGVAAVAGLLVALDRAVVARAPNPVKPPHAVPEPYDQVRVINAQIRAQWKANGYQPSRLTNDYEFIRRASLDIIGRIATPTEIEQFMHDAPPMRRQLLIDRLLRSEEFARNWANIWSVWLMTRSVPEVYQEQMQIWLQEQFARKRGWDQIVHELLTASGKSDDNGAVNFILSKEGMDVPPGEQAEQGLYDFVPLTSRTTRLFMGLQVQCCQCHDHPFNSDALWGKQYVFWGINAFFRQVRGDRMQLTPNRRMAMTTSLKLTDDPGLNPDASVFFEERKGTMQMTKARFIDGRKLAGGAAKNRREQLSDFVTGSDWFAKAYVNRLWGHFFGRGFTDPGPVDDFSEQNSITHPMLSPELLAKLDALKKPLEDKDELYEELKKLEDDREQPRLLDHLAQEFKRYKYDTRTLIRWICNSEAYQLASIANKSNGNDKADPFFSRMGLKSMSPEELFESLYVATGAGEGKPAAFKKQLRDRWMNNLVVNFGDDEGNEVTFNGTVVQALMLMNGNDLNDAISAKTTGTLAHALGKRSWQSVAHYLYLATLNRPPTARELRVISDEIANIRRGRSRNATALALWQDVFWALLNSNEFMLNH